eukprot:5429541-Lingulodinium_polyedra.AAC.1
MAAHSLGASRALSAHSWRCVSGGGIPAPTTLSRIRAKSAIMRSIHPPAPAGADSRSLRSRGGPA